MRLMRRAALGATALAVVTTLSGCQSGGGDGGGSRDERDRTQARTAAVRELRTVERKTGEAGSARIEATVSGPGAPGGGMTLSGVTGWNPAAMDVTVGGGAFGRGAGEGGTRVLQADGVLYVNIGEGAAERLGGKPWLKADLGALAEKSGDGRALDALTGGLNDVNQDPARQVALLLDSPDVERVGEETVGGVATEHYRGTLTVEDALEAGSSSEYLTGEEREELLRGMEKSGVEGFEIDLWVDGRDRPVKTETVLDGPRGALTVSQTYRDYGTGLSVEPPPTAATTDLLEALEGMGLGPAGA